MSLTTFFFIFRLCVWFVSSNHPQIFVDVIFVAGMLSNNHSGNSESSICCHKSLCKHLFLKRNLLFESSEVIVGSPDRSRNND